jgi:Putative restriction endonuclease
VLSAGITEYWIVNLIDDRLEIYRQPDCHDRNLKEVFAQTDSHKLATPEDWWTMVMGGGIRGTVDQLDPATRERVRSVNMQFLRDNNIYVLDSDVLYAIAQK